jgi:hypothetical protein
MSVHLQRQLEALIAKPQPHAAGGAHLGKTIEDGVDRSDDGLVGMKQNLAVPLAPDEPDRQARRNSPRVALLRMPPLRRALSTYSSASLIVPFKPRSNRSLKAAGW